LAKGGNSGFYSANLQILPCEGIVIALIASGKASGDKLTEPILTGLLRDRKQLAAEGEPERPLESQPIPGAITRYAGYYAAENDAWKVSIDKSRRKLTIAPLATDKKPPLTLAYDDGYFYPPTDDTRYYFGTASGTDFIAANVRGLTGYHIVVAQKLQAIRRPLRLQGPMQDELWLIRNAPASVELLEEFPKPIVISSSHKELPGYVDFAGIRRIERADFATMAATAVRDQTDLAFVPGKGGPLGEDRTPPPVVSPGRTEAGHRRRVGDDRRREPQRVAGRRDGRGARLHPARQGQDPRPDPRRGAVRQPRRRQ
jgi:hypothetical protein